jgi:hypothetical protein
MGKHFLNFKNVRPPKHNILVGTDDVSHGSVHKSPAASG